MPGDSHCLCDRLSRLDPYSPCTKIKIGGCAMKIGGRVLGGEGLGEGAVPGRLYRALYVLTGTGGSGRQKLKFRLREAQDKTPLAH